MTSAHKIKIYDTEFPNPNKSCLLPQHPARIMITGPSNSGKTNLLLNLLLDKDAPYKQIYVFYKIWQPKYDILKKDFEDIAIANEKKHKNKKKKSFTQVIEELNEDQSLHEPMKIEFIQGMPEDNFVDKFKSSRGIPRAIVFDDLMTSTDASGSTTDMFTVGSHHLNLSVFVLTQKIFTNKTQRLNLEYLFIFAFPADQTNPRILFQQLEPIAWRELFTQYKKCTEKPYSWFMIDLQCLKTDKKYLKYRCGELDNVFILEPTDKSQSEEFIEPLNDLEMSQLGEGVQSNRTRINKDIAKDSPTKEEATTRTESKKPSVESEKPSVKILETIEKIKKSQYDIQSVVFKIDLWGVENAKRWLKDHKLKTIKRVDRTKNSLRYRINDPDKYKDFRTINLKGGILFVLGFK